MGTRSRAGAGKLAECGKEGKLMAEKKMADDRSRDIEKKTVDEHARESHDELDRAYAALKARGLSLNMARGKPSRAQLALSAPLLTTLERLEDCVADDGTDCCNYGVLTGLPEAKRLMAVLLDDAPDNVIVGGASSLTLMYNALARCLAFGTLGSAPWSTYESIAWICPVPGYDRHFAMLEAFGIEMIPVRMGAAGPDMDAVEHIAASDERVKGMWCVPQYANPSGTTYSDETVLRLARMECAADDFRIFWDNAYAVHHLADDAASQERVSDIASACRAAGNPDRCFKFASTSKITFPGAGLAAFAASPANVDEAAQRMGAYTIGYDKLNQLRHVRFLKDASGIAAHMRAHAAILRPKFALVEEKLSNAGLAQWGCSWSHPQGGYFVSFNAPHGTAARIVELAREAGVVLTKAGATWPYGHDPEDSNIRIAPTLPTESELACALDVFACCVKLACAERDSAI